MKNPLRDEGAAFQVVLITIAAFSLIALASWVHRWLGVAVAAMLLIAAAAAIRRGLGSRVPPERATPEAPGPAPSPVDEGAPLLLLLSADGGDDDAVVDRASAIAATGPTRAVVVVPALDTAARAWSEAREQAVVRARTRAEQAVARLRAAGIEAEGVVGPVDGERALDDAVRAHGTPSDLVVAVEHAAVAARLEARLGLRRR